MPTPTRIFKDNGRQMEAHIFGEYVAVCWSLTKSREFAMIEGEELTRVQYARSGKPYIDFVSIRKFGDGSEAIDDDSPVAGGIGPDTSDRVIKELTLAVEYLRSL